MQQNNSFPAETSADHWVAWLGQQAERQPDRRVFEFLPDGREVADWLSYAELDRRARLVAANLQSLAPEGSRVLILMPNGIDYIVGFFASLYAGMIAVTAYPPQHKRRDWRRLTAIVEDCSAGVLLTDEECLGSVTDWASSQKLSAPVVAVAAAPAAEAEAWREPRLSSDDIALLQYSSGSTGTPKGVAVSHGNLFHNVAMIQREMRIDASDVWVSWLPLFHDMGLIGLMLTPLYCGSRVQMIPPPLVMQQPLRWLELIARSRATISGGPNFIYDHCVDRVTPEQVRALDLSHWRVAFNGAEPIRAVTLERFVRHFAGAGLKVNSLAPCYGLAEATLFVTGTSPGEPYATLTVEDAELALGRVRPVDQGRTLVSSGPINPQMTVRIVDQHHHHPLADNEVGEIWVRGASVAGRYWGRDRLSADMLAAELDGQGPYLRTGDLGFVHDGQLFVCGRAKELIVIRGRNLYPQDIEATAQEVSPLLTRHGGAAFALETAAGEVAVLVQEITRSAVSEIRSGGNLDGLVGDIRSAVARDHDIPLHAVVLISPASLMRTTSGKIQRGAACQAYMLGELTVVAQWCAEEDGESPSALPLPEGDTAGIADWLCRWIAAETRVAPAQMLPDMALVDTGLDSMGALTLTNELATRLGIRLPSDTLSRHATIAELADYLATATTTEAPAPAWQEGAL